MVKIVIILILVLIIGILFLFLNVLVYNKNAYIARHINSTVPRNIDRLIIGDFCNPRILTENKIYVCIQNPSGQSEQAINLIAKRLFSLLDEEKGILTIIRKKKNHKINGISVFDIPFLHENTLADLRLSKMKILCKLPILFNLIGSFKILFNFRNNVRIVKADCPIVELVEFCKKRNIKLEYYYYE